MTSFSKKNPEYTSSQPNMLRALYIPLVISLLSPTVSFAEEYKELYPEKRDIIVKHLKECRDVVFEKLFFRKPIQLEEVFCVDLISDITFNRILDKANNNKTVFERHETFERGIRELKNTLRTPLQNMLIFLQGTCQPVYEKATNSYLNKATLPPSFFKGDDSSTLFNCFTFLNDSFIASTGVGMSGKNKHLKNSILINH